MTTAKGRFTLLRRVQAVFLLVVCCSLASPFFVSGQPSQAAAHQEQWQQQQLSAGDLPLDSRTKYQKELTKQWNDGHRGTIPVSPSQEAFAAVGTEPIIVPPFCAGMLFSQMTASDL